MLDKLVSFGWIDGVRRSLDDERTMHLIPRRAWDQMNDVDDLLIPDDLREPLVATLPAWEFFSTFPPSVTRNILRWIVSAKTSPTRTKRITATVAQARHGGRVKSNG